VGVKKKTSSAFRPADADLTTAMETYSECGTSVSSLQHISEPTFLQITAVQYLYLKTK